MLDIKFVRENLDLLEKKFAERGIEISLGPLRELEEDRRQLLRNIENLRQQRNASSKEIAARKMNGEGAEEDIRAMREVGERIKDLEQKMRECEEALGEHLHELPNLQDESVPAGMTEEDNIEVRRWGKAPEFDFTPRPHWDVGEELGRGIR